VTVTTGPALRAPALAALRLVAGVRSSALVDEQGAVVWWCAPAPDSTPLFWRLLGPEGGVARWCDVVHAAPKGDEIAAALETEVVTVRGSFDVRDSIVGDQTLVRALHAHGQPVLARLEITRPPFGDANALTNEIHVDGADRLSQQDRSLFAEVDLTPSHPRTIAISIGPSMSLGPPSGWLETAIAAREQAWNDVTRRARLPRDHPQRVVDALRVLAACTYEPTGAVIAAPTTSIPETPDGQRNWDYRYCWLRDASIAASVASVLGQPGVAERYLGFVCGQSPLARGSIAPVATVEGQQLPPERSIHMRRWWRVGRVRVSNAASDHVQLDALGFLAEALWTHRKSGRRIGAGRISLVSNLAESALVPPGRTNGIWEFRELHPLVSAEIGRWLLLDRAIRLRRADRPWIRTPRTWHRARADARSKVEAVIDRHGWVPHAFEGRLAGEPDAVGLLAVIVGLLGRDSARAQRVVDATIEALGDGPFVRRARPGIDDGFEGIEGAFVPASWWAVSALAVLGRIDEAEDRADAMCKALPKLIPEEWDVRGDAPLGNTPLVWSHMEMARALHLLHIARIRRRFGTPGVAAWRTWRFGYVALART
jgi:hypothetical protein